MKDMSPKLQQLTSRESTVCLALLRRCACNCSAPLMHPHACAFLSDARYYSAAATGGAMARHLHWMAGAVE